MLSIILFFDEEEVSEGRDSDDAKFWLAFWIEGELEIKELSSIILLFDFIGLNGDKNW